MNKKNKTICASTLISGIIVMSFFIGCYYGGQITNSNPNNLKIDNFKDEEDFEIIMNGNPNASDVINSGCGKWFYEFLPSEWQLNSTYYNLSFYEQFYNKFYSNYEEWETYLEPNTSSTSLKEYRSEAKEFINDYILKTVKPYFETLLGPSDPINSQIIQLTDNISIKFTLKNSFYEIIVRNNNEICIDYITGFGNGFIKKDLIINPDKYSTGNIYKIEIKINTEIRKEFYFSVVKEETILLTPPLYISRGINPITQFYLIEDEDLLLNYWPFEKIPQGVGNKQIEIQILNNYTWENFSSDITQDDGNGQLSLLKANPSSINDDFYISNFVYKPEMLIYDIKATFNGDENYLYSTSTGRVAHLKIDNMIDFDYINHLLRLNDSNLEKNFSNEKPKNSLQYEPILNQTVEEDNKTVNIEYNNASLNLDVNVSQTMEYLNLKIEGTVLFGNYNPIANHKIGLYIKTREKWSFLENCKSNNFGKFYYQNFLTLDSGNYQIKAELNIDGKIFVKYSNFTYNRCLNFHFSNCMDNILPELVPMIKSYPIYVNYSDTANYKANITSIFGAPINGVNVTFFLYNHTTDYPWIFNLFPSLQKYYDYLYFYVYWYLGNGNKNCPFLDVFDLLLNRIQSSCWVHPIGSSITDEKGIAQVNNYTYLSPGKYNLVALVDFAPLLPDCIKEFFGIKNVWLYQIYMDYVNISKEQSMFTPIDLDTRYSDTSNISVKLTNDDGIPHISLETLNIPQTGSFNPIISSKKVSFYLFINQNWVYIGDNLTNENGIATIFYTPWLIPGEYNLKVRFLGDSLYTSIESIFNLTVKKEYMQFSNLNFTSRYSDLSKLLTQLQDDEQNPIPQLQDISPFPKNISFYLYHLNYTSFNFTAINQTTNVTVDWAWYQLGTVQADGLGLAEIEYTPWIVPADNYSIMISYLGDEYFYPLTKYGNLVVEKEYTILEFFENMTIIKNPIPISTNNFSMRYSDTSMIVSRLMDDERTLPISYRLLNYSIENETFGTITNEEGISSFNYISWLLPGNHNLISAFDGDPYFLSDNKTILIEVQKEITETSPLANLIYSDLGLIMVNLTDDEGLPINNKTAIIGLNFKGFWEIYSVPVIFNGIGVTFYQTYSIPGEYQAFAYFAGDEFYLSSTSFGLIKINKEFSVFDIKDIQYVTNVEPPYDWVIFEADLMEDDGPSIPQETVDFEILKKQIIDVSGEYLEFSLGELYEIFSYLGEIEALEISPYNTEARVTVYYWLYVGSAITNLNGSARLEVPKNLIGNEIYSARAIFLGNYYYEGTIGTGPLTITFDSDCDGLSDDDEINLYGTDPLNPDTDGDCLSDSEEILIYKTNPLNPDTDQDNLLDGEEILIYGSDSKNKNTDGDALDDGIEALDVGTSVLDPDLWIEIDWMVGVWVAPWDFLWIKFYFENILIFLNVTVHLILSNPIPYVKDLPINDFFTLTQLEHYFHNLNYSLYFLYADEPDPAGDDGIAHFFVGCIAFTGEILWEMLGWILFFTKTNHPYFNYLQMVTMHEIGHAINIGVWNDIGVLIDNGTHFLVLQENYCPNPFKNQFLGDIPWYLYIYFPWLIFTAPLEGCAMMSGRPMALMLPTFILSTYCGLCLLYTSFIDPYPWYK